MTAPAFVTKNCRKSLVTVLLINDDRVNRPYFDYLILLISALGFIRVSQMFTI